MDMGVDQRKLTHIVVVLLISLAGGVNAFTDPNDSKILNDFRNGLENSGLLEWPEKGNDPCGPPAWPHVVCSNGRVIGIHVQGLGLKGQLPPNLNQLEKLQKLGFQKNRFTGNLPSLSGLSNLESAYLDFNQFDTIPDDFFRGLRNVRVLALDNNPLNQTSGWAIPDDLAECKHLVKFSCRNCNIIGQIPAFFGTFTSLNSLSLSSNRLNGEIPSSFRDSKLQNLWLNDQEGGGMTGSIDVIGTMAMLTVVWLHGNQFSGPIPDSIGSLLSLKELNLSRNRLVGLIPSGLANLNLQVLDLSNNMLMGAIPKFNATNFSYDPNSFCQSVPGSQCDPQVGALLQFLDGVNYPEILASAWKGNDPCAGRWWGISCNARNQVSIIDLGNLGLNGTLSPSLVNLSSLLEIHLQGNDLHGVVPANLTQLKSLRLLNISGNKFELPLPKFRYDVKVIYNHTPSPSPSPSDVPLLPSTPKGKLEPLENYGPSKESNSHVNLDLNSQNQTKSTLQIIVASVVGSVILTVLAVLLAAHCLKKRKETTRCASVHPKDLLNSGNIVKIARASSMEAQSGTRLDNDLVLSFHDLRKVTNDFSRENELGRGGFGVVYMGKYGDGTKIAVKRMEAGVISDKAQNEFQTEITVLSTVRHRHLVSLLGYSGEGNERLLVYEYMPHGALSRHLFHWRSLKLQPLSWSQRLNIALDVARGVEYLHTLAHQSFIHRDLKSANILLDHDFRAKVSDFGLVKLALDSESSVMTRLAGTFGYLAPEYAATGKITTKVDVFSFGVILMELLTGLVAVDERRPEEKQYLVEWFWKIKSNRETLIASIDPAIDATEDIYESIYAMAELAGHCTCRDPNYRPEMRYAVSVLSQLVETWKPHVEIDRKSDMDSRLSLAQLVKAWKEEEYSGGSENSDGSIPAKPSGFADSFNSIDAR